LISRAKVKEKQRAEVRPEPYGISEEIAFGIIYK
jgi:hypothetical protein